MRDFLSWNFCLGRIAGVQVRWHVLFLLAAICIWHAAASEEVASPGWYTLTALSMLAVSVGLHEIGHCLAVRRLGGHCEQVLLWPLGGLTPASLPQEPKAEALAALAGPLMNLLASAATLPALLLMKWDWPSLLNPVQPPLPASAPPIEQGALLGLAMFCWLNWLLVLVNLLPAFPLDGGRLLRAALWAALGQRPAVFGAARVAQITALGLWIVCWFLPSDVARHAAAPLVLLGIIIFFAARQELLRHDESWDETTLGYDFSQGYTSLERQFDAPSPPAPGPVVRWFEERRQARRQRKLQIEVEEERRVDDILARLHLTGLEGLSSEDRALLDRVSARYRNRQGR